MSKPVLKLWLCKLRLWPAILLSIFASVTCGATLDEYHDRVDEARISIDQLLNSLENRDSSTVVLKQKAAEVAALVPPTERVEWPGGSIETGNEWLKDSLDDFSKEISTQKGRAILTGVQERLEAISNSVAALQKASNGETTKQETKERLAEILKRAEFHKPVQPDESLFQKIVRKISEWLDSLLPKPAVSHDSPSGESSLKIVLQIFIYLAVLSLVGFLVFKFFPLIAARFGSGVKTKKRERIILGERVSADQTAHDLLAEAERLASEGKLREAIRKGYIAVLCDLADRQIIGLARHKTNRDYLRDIGKRSDLIDDVVGLTNTYERNWYGLRPSSTPDWEEFRSRYDLMMSRARTARQ
jgi:Domain of unknown function (DUF4129)